MLKVEDLPSILSEIPQLISELYSFSSSHLEDSVMVQMLNDSQERRMGSFVTLLRTVAGGADKVLL